MHKNCAISQITPTMLINTFKQIQMNTLTQIYRRRYCCNEAAGKTTKTKTTSLVKQTPS